MGRGHPGNNSPAGALRVTTLPAPTTHPSPNSTSFTITTLAPIQLWLPILTLPTRTELVIGVCDLDIRIENLLGTDFDQTASIDHFVMVEIVPASDPHSDVVIVHIVKLFFWVKTF
jgi:hypothetical protein